MRGHDTHICKALTHLLSRSGPLFATRSSWGNVERSVQEGSVRLLSPCVYRARPIYKLHLRLSKRLSAFYLNRVDVAQLVVASKLARASLSALP